MKSQTLFTTDIIDNSRFRKLKPHRYALYFTVILIAGIGIQPRTMTNVHPSVLDRLDVPYPYYFIILVLFGLTALIFHWYSRQYVYLGKLILKSDKIQIGIDSTWKIIDFADISDLEIRRGATYHYQYKEDNYLTKCNNWISFSHKDEEVKHEFLIDSTALNTEFEEMIRYLQGRSLNLKYLSI